MSKTPKTLIIRANSSSLIGTGHIMRDLVLAKEYKNARVIFATQALEGNINHKILEEGYVLEILQDNSLKALNTLLKKHSADMLVFDSYEIDYSFEKAVKEDNPALTVMSLDDTYERHYCDILLNHNISADVTKYKGLVPSFCELRCGSKYTLLREEFYREKSIKREKIYDIFIAMGGADTANLNTEILETLAQELRVAVVTTQANKNLKALKKYTQKKKNISLFVNSNAVAKLMNQSKLAIVTPSVTLNELFFLNLPFVAIKTADNQSDIYEWLLKKSYTILESFNAQALKNLLSINIYLHSQLKNFTKLSKKELEEVLEMRNHKEVRKQMFTQESITLNSHLHYCNKLKTSPDREYFLVQYLEEKLGVIDFVNITKQSCEIGLYKNMQLTEAGIGQHLLSLIIEYAFRNLCIQTIIAEVFAENTKAYALYTKFSFKEVEKKLVNAKELIKMELHR